MTTPPATPVPDLIAALTAERDKALEAALLTPANRAECLIAHTGIAAGLDIAIHHATAHAARSTV